MKIDIGKRIIELREYLRLPRYKFAEAIFFNAKTIYRWETNQTVPSVNDIQLISDTFGINPAYFYCSDERAGEYLDSSICKNALQNSKKKPLILILFYVLIGIFGLFSVFLLSLGIYLMYSIQIADNNDVSNVVLKYTSAIHLCTVLFVVSFSLLIAICLIYVIMHNKIFKNKY